MKYSFLLVLIFLSLIIYADINHFNGITGTTKLNGGDGCICHALEPNDSVHVWIEGPDSVFVGDSAQYKIYLTGGSAVAGGLNVASRHGGLSTVDSSTQIIFEELTHSFPLEFAGDTIWWNFSYHAPDSISMDTIYSVANSVNLDGNPQVGDMWNYGENFAVNIVDDPVSVEIQNKPEQFYLAQNYPNPFNPVTNIRYSINKPAQIKLIVFDLLGNEMATLVNEHKIPGSYEVQYSMSDSEFPSGVYFYRLFVNTLSQTKKMILLR